MAVPGVTIEGEFSFELNNSGVGVNEDIAFGQQTGSSSVVALADLNGDSRPDLIASTNGASGSNVFVYFNDGSGDPFDSLPPIEVGTSNKAVTAIATGDLKVTAQSTWSWVSRHRSSNHVYLNDGAGKFTASSEDIGTRLPRSLSAT